MSALDAFVAKVASGDAVVGVVGLGYVGLPLAEAVHASGLRVIGIDIDEAKVRSLRAGTNYLPHLGEDMTRRLAASERFRPTSDLGAAAECDAVLVCVPTPLGPHREPDLSFVEATGRSLGGTLRRGQLLVLESTTYPGTTRDVFLPSVLSGAGARASGLTPGRDFFVAFSPERGSGRTTHTTSTIPKLVGGLDAASARAAAALYGRFISRVIEVSSAEVAEAAKLLENIFRAVNIALVNEMKVVLAELGIDVWEVIRAASTKPFGFMPFVPGPGLGGHCIPIDPFYLSWKAREVGRPTRFIELAGEVNTAMPGYVIERLGHALNERGIAFRGARVLVLGLAYKPDVADTRESPSFEIIHRLRTLGASVDYSDPHVPRTVPVRRHDLGMTSVELSPESVSSYDAVLIATNHRGIDYGMLASNARLIVDTRNAMAPFEASLEGRLVKA